MQFKSMESGIEVYGVSIDAIVEAFRLFPSIALKRLANRGIGSLHAKGEIHIDREQWYPQEAWLAAFEDIATAVGSQALYQIGQHVPKHAVFPPTVNDIQSGIASVDVAYHMNHKKRGRPMFDPATGTMLEGIGHYGYKPTAGKNHILSVCENPYPCDFDRGILAAIATRFQKRAVVVHDEKAECRKTGGNSCTYGITW